MKAYVSLCKHMNASECFDVYCVFICFICYFHTLSYAFIRFHMLLLCFRMLYTAFICFRILFKQKCRHPNNKKKLAAPCISALPAEAGKKTQSKSWAWKGLYSVYLDGIAEGWIQIGRHTILFYLKVLSYFSWYGLVIFRHSACEQSEGASKD